ncbi:elongation factor Ts [Candidatus Falkowbacteria bacterium CG11_big_fil_rev_8_21_14_0_20_39_10]|uniref:Elongation factor Ts n=1 Tax=Candidatus Falkowbacteria bacterium CG11_big_fil_rev_8_21_14_0_20_39_10 TaxID=1974570 RepID=A0A2M6K9D1_9BACT|nr:MAG: elongation factor Ts [Candidatus Falkowbacteria bacterium CG11_big_fil_rev_8_21_14_0_20_39_10]
MIDYSKLKQLRSKTQVSFSLCKKALEESDNDIEKSMKLLKKWGIEKAKKKADRETKAGGIFSYIHHNKKIASLIELQSETDFVSGNDDFKKLGSEIAMQAASVRSDNLDEFLIQDYIREPGKTIDSLVKDAILKFGENIKIARILRWELGE